MWAVISANWDDFCHVLVRVCTVLSPHKHSGAAEYVTGVRRSTRRGSLIARLHPPRYMWYDYVPLCDHHLLCAMISVQMMFKQTRLTLTPAKHRRNNTSQKSRHAKYTQMQQVLAEYRRTCTGISHTYVVDCTSFCTCWSCAILNKKLSCRENVRLLRGSVSAKYNWKTRFRGMIGLSSTTVT